MTKKHFIDAARIVKLIDDRTVAAHVATAFVELFRSYNGRFDRDRFLTACGF